MLFDPGAADASFVEGRPPDNIREIVHSLRKQLGLDGSRPWTLISARTKLGRILFEVEEQTANGPRRFIGKVGRVERVETLYRALKALRAAGFKPPSRITVPEPVACLPECGVVLQEKVPGRSASDLLFQSSGRASIAAADCARWLVALHEGGVTAPQVETGTRQVHEWVRELAETLPKEAVRLEKIAEAISIEARSGVSVVVPAHGDFHPMNVIIAGNTRVTGIDIDKFGCREREADLGWFLMQTAAFGHFRTGTFEATDAARRLFMRCYEAEIGNRVQANRVALHMAMAFLKNLHFELVLLKTGHTELAAPWLGGAARVLEGDIYLSKNS
jgi:aminoglycoside phosphotransferase (APT) family kinase protein